MTEAGRPTPRGAEAPTPPQSPGRVFWRQFRRNPLALTGAVLLALFYALAALAPFIAPYAQDELDRGRFYHPPQALHWQDATGRLHLRPFVCPTVPGQAIFEYREDHSRELPLRFFVRGARYRLLGVLPCGRHLFGVDPPGRVNLLGTDPAGRDEFSRVLFGAQVSLTVGLVGILISFALGLLLGGVSGYLGGWVDGIIMRSSEVLLSIPGLYLIIALRTVFPASLPRDRKSVV